MTDTDSKDTPAEKEWEDLINYAMSLFKNDPYPKAKAYQIFAHCKELREALAKFADLDKWESVSGDNFYVPNAFGGKWDDPCGDAQEILNKRPGEYE